jgi:hypothetical protein
MTGRAIAACTACLAALAVLTGCASPGIGMGGPAMGGQAGGTRVPDDVEGLDTGDPLETEEVLERTRLEIPPGQLPPPGECRVWRPGVPPGQQPPPGPCDAVSAELTPGDWLIRRTWKRPARVRVIEFGRELPLVRLRIRIHAVDNGMLLGVEEPE